MEPESEIFVTDVTNCKGLRIANEFSPVETVGELIQALENFDPALPLDWTITVNDVLDSRTNKPICVQVSA